MTSPPSSTQGTRPHIHIRRTTANDGNLLREIRLASLADAPHAFNTPLQEALALPEEHFVSEALRQSRSELATSFLLFDGEKLAGTVGAFFKDLQPPRPLICALWVTPALRGTSAASRLVKTAVEWLRARGAQNVHAWVADSNVHGQLFYKKLGFHATAEQRPRRRKPEEDETLYRLGI